MKTFLADEVLVVVEMGAPAGILEGNYISRSEMGKILRIAKRNRKNDRNLTRLHCITLKTRMRVCLGCGTASKLLRRFGLARKKIVPWRMTSHSPVNCKNCGTVATQKISSC